ncbi:MAG: hypothetical protein HGA22_03905 [Clostridiales bacterium]|nr:hypothetical protein [Clostridiales bacterium]
MRGLKRISVIVAGALLVTAAAGAFVYASGAASKIEALLDPTVKITVNGQEYTGAGAAAQNQSEDSRTEPIIYNGHVYLPVRSTADIAGMDIAWDEKSRTVKLSSSTGKTSELATSGDNTLKVGDAGKVVLDGNITTGYSWQYKIEGTSVEAFSEESSQDSNPPGLVGAGSTYTWTFKAVSGGKSTITFKYYRPWEGEASTAPEDIRVYTVNVEASK